VSDQKYEAAISIDSFLSISAMESLMHWSILRSPQYTSFVLLTLKNQSFHPLVGFVQDRKVSFHRSKEKFSALRNPIGLCVDQISGIWVTHWAEALEMGLFSRDHNFLTQLLKFEDWKKKRKGGENAE